MIVVIVINLMLKSKDVLLIRTKRCLEELCLSLMERHID